MRTAGIQWAIALAFALAATGAWSAETYKWVDEKGVTTYGSKPPAGRTAKPVDTTPSGPVGGTADPSAPQDRQPEGARRPAEQAPRPQASAVPPAPAAGAPVRGMEFQTFARLQRGMTEGELLQRAGRPDHESVENFRNDIVKTWYYFPTPGDPFTTVVTVRGGRIDNLDRVKKF